MFNHHNDLLSIILLWCYNFLNLFFYWRVITLQNFGVFCQTSTWISHGYTYIPSLLNLPPISLPILPPPRLIQSPCLSFLAIQQIPVGCLFYKFPCYSFHTSHPLLPSPHIHKSILFVCFSLSEILQYHFSRFCIYALEYSIYLSLSDLLHRF